MSLGMVWIVFPIPSSSFKAGMTVLSLPFSLDCAKAVWVSIVSNYVLSWHISNNTNVLRPIRGTVSAQKNC